MENNTSLPMINRLSLDLLYGGAEPPKYYNDIPLTPYVPINVGGPDINPSSNLNGTEGTQMSLSALRNLKSTERRFEPTKSRTQAELTDRTGRYDFYSPNYNNEDAYGQNQAFTTKAFNGFTKGLALTGTTFLQTTAGLLNGVYQAANDGRFASFYDNEMNRTLDEFNKGLEVSLATYDTDKFKNAKWYSPDYLLTGNFIFEGVLKNLGFAAGAALSGMAFAPGVAALGKVFGKIPKIGKLLSVGKAAEVAAATEAGLNSVNGINKLKKVSDGFLSTWKALNPAQRYVVAGLSTTGEAGIEAYHNLNEFRDNAIEQYTVDNGFAPIGQDLIGINKLSDEVGNMSMGMNMVLLSATNYIQFPKILGSSYRAEKGILNNLSKSTKNIVKKEGKYVVSQPTTKFGKGFKKVRKAIQNPYIFSYSEAFEEGSQFAISKATEDYYNKKHNNEDHDWLSSIIEGYEETLTSDEGQKNILIGGLSGAIMLGTGRYKTSKKVNQNTSEALKGLNNAELSDFTKDTYDAVSRGTKLQEEREKFLEEGNVLDSKDIEDDYVINYLTPRIKYGRYDLVKSDINTYRELASSEEGWDQLVKEGKAQEGDTPQAFLSRLSKFETTAENVKSLYQSLTLRYGGLKGADGKKIYTNEVMDKLVYAASKIAAFDNRYEQLSAEIFHKDVSLEAIIEDVISGDETSLDKAVKAIKEDKKLNATQKDELIEKLYDAASIGVRRDGILSEYNDIKESPSQYTTSDSTEIKKEDEGETIKVKTPKGEKTVVIGKEYYMMPEVNYTDATTIGIREPYKVIVLGENEDGTIKIQGKNGTVRNVTKEELSSYNMGSVEFTEKSKKAKYVLDNLNDEFVHYGVDEFGNKRQGKNKEEPAKGYLHYTNSEDKLLFVFKTPNGKVIKREVSNTLFKAKEGFDGAMIRRTDKNISKQKQKIESAFTNEKLTMSQKFQQRTAIIKKLVDENRGKLDRISKRLIANKKRLENIDKEIEDSMLTKAGKPRKRPTKALQKLIKELHSLKETLPAEIERLEAHKISGEAQQEILDSYLEDLPALDGNSKIMLQTIKEDIDSLEEMIDLTKDSITSSKKQLSLVDTLYQKALSLMNDFLTRLKEENPSLPFSIDELKDNLERFLGATGSEQFIENKEGFTNQVLELENNVLEFQEELKLPQLDKKAESISKNIKELTEGLSNLIEKQIALVNVLDAFDEFVKQEEAKQATEKILKDNPTVLKTLKSTQDRDGETVPFDEDYVASAKKSTLILPTSSIGIQDGKGYQERANLFGFNLPEITANKKNIRGVYVTAQTEELLGLKGLTEMLAMDEQSNLKKGVDPAITIVSVMVSDVKGELKVVDVNGEIVEDNDGLDQGIFQVHPLETLTWANGESMIRSEKDGGPNDAAKTEMLEKFKEWRDEVLSRKEIGSTFKPLASLGHISYERDEDNVINYEQRTSVAAAGFIGKKSDFLKSNVVINIPTVEEIVERGTTRFVAPYKRVLLKAPNGHVQLQNKKHNKEQATTIYKSILEISKELVAENGKIESVNATRVLNYLKGVVYWGTPETREGKRKDVGYSSIFFETDKEGNHLLYIGKNKANVVIFTPLELERSSAKIIESIEKLYTNTSNKKIQEISASFEEITDIENDGTIVSTMWPNYQTYLLSDKLPINGKITAKSKSRTGNNIPLTTYANPITEENPVNRTGIYFYNPELIEYFRVETVEKTNFKDDLKADKEITDEDVIEFIETTDNKLKEALHKKWPNVVERLENYKKMYVDKHIKRIAEIAIGKTDQEKYKAFVKDTIEKISNYSIDEQVKLIGNGYINALKSTKVVVPKKEQNPFKKDLSLFKDPKEVALEKLFPKQNKPSKDETPIKPEDDVQIKIDDLRQQEQEELLEAIPNAEDYLTDGKVDKKKLTNPDDINTFEKIYDNYDPAISSLLESQSAQQTGEVDIFLKKESLAKAPTFAQKAIAKIVEAIPEDVRLKVIKKAYEGVTATFIANSLNLTTEQVRSIRTYYGAPDIADKKEYKKWKDGITAKLAAKPAQQTGEVDTATSEYKISESKDVLKEYDRKEISTILRSNTSSVIEDFLGNKIEEIITTYEKGKAVRTTYQYGIIDKVSASDGSVVSRLLDLGNNQVGTSNMDINMGAMERFNKAKFGNDGVYLGNEDIVSLMKDSLGKPSQQTSEVKDNTDNESNQFSSFTKKKPGDFRTVLDNKYDKAVVEDWDKVQEFLKKVFPNTPVFRVKNIMEAAGGQKLWGMFQDGAIYVYENAEVGTAYHEVFEAVWKMFSNEQEQTEIIEEFKARTGEFLDRPSGNKIKYVDATDYQIKEQLAEEFRKYVLKDGLPQQSLKNRILNMFKDLVKFIRNLKTLFKSNNKDKVDDLFKKINTGGFKTNIKFASQLSFANKGIQDIENVIVNEGSEFSAIPGVTSLQRNDVVHHLLYKTLSRFVSEDSNLFSLQGQPITDEILLEDIKSLGRDEWESINNYFDQKTEEAGDDLVEVERLDRLEKKNKLQLKSLYDSIEDNFDKIKESFKSKVKSFDIILDENDYAQVESEEKTRNSDYVDATKVDSFRKMNSAFKLLFSTVVKLDKEGYLVNSSIGGVITLSFGEVKNTLIKTLHKSKNIPDMLDRFRKLAEIDPNYRLLYKRFTRTSYTEKDAGFVNINTNQSFMLLSGLWKNFSLAAPQVKNVFILSDGTVEVGDANLASAAAQLREKYMDTIILNSKSGKGFFTYSSDSNGVYNVNRKAVKRFILAPDYLQSYSSFLKKLGVDFSLENIKDLNASDLEHFKVVVSAIKMSLNRISSVKSFNAKELDLTKRLFNLALLKSKVSNPAYQTTFFNVSGERTQTFIGGNSPRRLYRALSQIENISDLDGTEFDYLITDRDSFVDGSVILDKLIDEDGDVRQSEVEKKLLESGYVGGIINESKHKNTPSAKLSLRDRLIQELNVNLKGWYLNLVPGDSSTEWMTFMSNHVSTDDLGRGMENVHNIYKNYFISEYNLSRENRKVYTDPNDSKKSRNPKELRFFKGILYPATLMKVNRSQNKSAEKVYDDNVKAIRSAIEEHIETNTSSLRNALNSFDIIKESGDGKVYLENINIKETTEEKMNLHLKMLTVNYMINNIEMFKLLYGDPYQYKDFLKRSKSFQSPRQEILNSSIEVNTLMHKIWNKNYKEGDLGYTNFVRDFFKTVTYADVRVVEKEFADYGFMEETDGGGIIFLNALRNFKLRSSDWHEDNERQFAYEIAWEKNDKGLDLNPMDVKALKAGNPGVRSTFTAIKPIVTGNRHGGKTYNETVLDKYSLYGISYRMMKEIGAVNGVKLHNKMLSEDVDYVIFNSGRKVGAYDTATPYKENGEFNSSEFTEEQFIHVPFAILGLQVEVPTKPSHSIPRATQVTKLITMDRMDAGVPVDFTEKHSDKNTERQIHKLWWSLESEEDRVAASPLFKEILNNKKLLDAQIEQGFEILLKKLGFTRTRNGVIRIDDFTKTVELIKKEVLSREASDNIIAALDGFMVDNIILEATPAYRQISNILYSLVDKNVLHGKITGSSKVQIASTFWEENRLKISDLNGKKGYTSDALKFYSKGEVDEKTGKVADTNVMEIMVGRWFKSDMTDKELLKFLNDTAEGQKILRGFAFRIPTQNMNSIDAFRIKKFLPEEFGDNVVVPSAIVGKTGSDFDIDKLTMYLKSVFIDANNKPKLIPFFGIGKDAVNKAKAFRKEVLLEKIKALNIKLEKSSLQQSLFADLMLENTDEKTKNKWIPIFKEWFADKLIDGKLPVQEIENIFMNRLDKIGKTLDELTDEDVFNTTVEEEGEQWYMKGLQNAYIESNENLLLHPTNYKKLTSKNSAESLKKLSNKIHIKKGNKEVQYSNPVNFLDRVFMSKMRHNFVSGKQAVGIAAVGATNNANNQGQNVTVNYEDIENASLEEQAFLKKNGGKINFRNFNTIFHNKQIRPTFSKRLNKAGEYISDLLGMFVDGYVDISDGAWIMEMGATPQTAGTWMFLLKLGIPKEDVAFFMNQPIIIDYLQMIENKGYNWLFIDSFRDELQENKYSSSIKPGMSYIPSSKVLWKTIGETKLSEQQKADQQFYLDDFLKYSMMARHLFYVTQGTNFDTANFNNSYLLFKKQQQYLKAKSSMIGGVDEIINNTFLKKTKDSLIASRDLFSNILISDKPNVSKVVQDALLPYINLSDREFVKMAQKIITNLFDYVVQTQEGLNEGINYTLIDKNNSVQKLSAFIKNMEETHPLYNNYALSIAEILPSKTAELGSTDNVRIKLQSSEIYDKNRLIHAFKEIKEFSDKENITLYKEIVSIAVLQSGLSPSNMSFTEHIPFDDFASVYNEALSQIEKRIDLDVFQKLNVFQRNNWNNNDVVQYMKASFFVAAGYNPGMKFLMNFTKINKAVTSGTIPPIVNLPVGDTMNKDTVVYSWELGSEILTEEEKLKAKKEGKAPWVAVKEKKVVLKSIGDYSYIKKALMQKVYKKDGSPRVYTYINKAGEERNYYVFKAINAWGNGSRANEFYDVARKSVINNGFEKVTEVSDETILPYISAYETSTKNRKKSSLPKQSSRPLSQGNNVLNITFKGKWIVVNNKTYPSTFINYDKLVSLGYTEDQAGEIIDKFCNK